MSEEYVLQLQHIRKEYPGVVALKDVTLELKPGEILALIGENGAGKSTLIKILAGAYSRDSGEIFFEGKKLGNLSPKQVQTLGISTIYQEFNLIPHLNIAENIFLGKEPLSHGLLDKKELYKKATEIINRHGP